MQVEVPFDAPVEIKKKIAKQNKRKGALSSIERKIKLGLLISIEELREDPNGESKLERKKFKNANSRELEALWSVFNFLAEHNLTYTLSTILEESCVQRNKAQKTRVEDLIQFIEDSSTDDSNLFSDD